MESAPNNIEKDPVREIYRVFVQIYQQEHIMNSDGIFPEEDVREVEEKKDGLIESLAGLSDNQKAEVRKELISKFGDAVGKKLKFTTEILEELEV